MLVRLLQISFLAGCYSSALVGAFSSRGHRTMSGSQINNRPGCFGSKASQKTFLGARENEGEEKTPRSDTANDDDRVSKKQKTPAYSVSVCAEIGRRAHMEDKYLRSRDGDFCAVFDGHGSDEVSNYLSVRLPFHVRDALYEVQETERPTVMDYSNAFTQGIKNLDEEVRQHRISIGRGSTVVAAWLHEDKSTSSTKTTKTVVVANVGDSRAVLSRGGVAIALTRDHKPNDPIERARIEAAGGSVKRDWLGISRVDGHLSVARSIGCRFERPLVSGEPEVSSEILDETCDEFIVLASDGLWDVMSSQKCVSFVHTKLDEAKNNGSGNFAEDKEKIATLVVEEALKRSSDNVSVVIIWLDVSGK